MKKKLMYFVMAVMMVAMTACGSNAGKSNVQKEKSESAADAEVNNNEPENTDDKNDTDATNDSGEESSEENIGSDDAEEAADSALPTDDEELNEYGLTDSQMQFLYDCVKESVLTGYIELNDIDPEEFQWPGPDKESDKGFAWHYLAIMYLNYTHSGSKYDTTDFGFEKPDDSLCQLMNSVLDGMIECSDTFAEKIYKIRIGHIPFDDLFPENIEFTSGSD